MADPVKTCAPSPERFRDDGYVIIPELVEEAYCQLLKDQLEAVLRGQYDIPGGAPDKTPPFNKDARSKPGKTPLPLGGPSKRTLQVINIWKASAAFSRLVLSPTLGELVAKLAGWPVGARVANDQVWAKPPGAAPLTFHRDSPYFDFIPGDVVTVWIALDDMDDEIGPLEYVPTSHRWGDGRVGSAEQFFDARDRFALLYDAARREGIADPQSSLRIERLAVRSGGAGIHDGRLWHGSGKNKSDSRPRRGLGIHFVPADARFRDAAGGYQTQAHRFRDPDGGDELLPAFFPITWHPTCTPGA
jgi:phytanoyl-CoA hydroxylase